MATEKKNAKNNKIISILTPKEISYQPYIKYPENSHIKIPKKILEKEEESKNENIEKENTTAEKINLISTLNNSLINKDFETFLWCLTQQDKSIIETTCKKMDIKIIKLFFEKAIELFQSNKLGKKNIHIWLKYILLYHKFSIIGANDNEIINNLKLLQSFITNYTKYYSLLNNLDSKLNLVFEGIKNNNKIKEDDNPEPFLNYIESDDEKDIQMQEELEKKMNDRGFKAVHEGEEEENSEEDLSGAEADFDMDMVENEEDFEDMEDLMEENEEEENKKENEEENEEMEEDEK